MDYDIYHDESKEAGYWHGILFVPSATRATLLEHLQRIREHTGWTGVVGLKGIDKTTGKRFRCARTWTHLGVAALIQKPKGLPYPYYTGIDGRTPGLGLVEKIIGVKFALFRVRDGHQSLQGYPDYGAKVETTFRMGLKGGLHLFADEAETLTVKSFHFDGHEHYRRRVDSERIVGRLGELRPEVRIPDEIEIDDRTSDHTREGCQSEDDCQLLQLADLFVSGFRTVLGTCSQEAQRHVAQPLVELAKRWHEGPARMRNSRWHKGFSISECYLEDKQWQFGDLRPAVIDTQLPLNL